MAKLQAYTQRQLRSSIVGVPGVDQSGQMVAAGLANLANTVASGVLSFNANKIKAEDSLSVNKANESRDLARLETQQFMQNNPDPSTWAEGKTNIVQRQQLLFSNQTFSMATAREQSIEQKAFENELGLSVDIAASARTIDNDVTASGKNYIGVLGNPLAQPSRVAQQKKLYQDALERKHEKSVADSRMAETEIQGQEQRIENLNEIARNFAAADPNSVTNDNGTGTADRELEARKKGTTLFDEFSELSNSDILSIKQYANASKSKRINESTIAVNDATERDFGLIREGATDITAMANLVAANPDISSEDSTKHSNDIINYYNKFNSTKVADETDQEVYDMLTQASESVERGSMTPAAFEDLYVNNKEKLDEDDQRLIRNKDIVATKSMQNRSFLDASSEAGDLLVEVKGDELTSIKLARQNAVLIQDVPSINMFNISLKKNQAQRWNFSRFKKQLRNQIAQNKTWDQKQIYTAQETLQSQFNVSDDILLRQFSDANPSRSILKTAPDDVFNEVWGDLSQEDKSIIWSERMAGTPVEVLLGSMQVQEAGKDK